MNEQERFVAKHCDSDFRHKDELFGALAAGKSSLDLLSPENPSIVSCSHLLNLSSAHGTLQQFSTPPRNDSAKTRWLYVTHSQRPPTNAVGSGYLQGGRILSSPFLRARKMVRFLVVSLRARRTLDTRRSMGKALAWHEPALIVDAV